MARHWKLTDPYPHGASFEDLLEWHLTVWGTNEKATMARPGRPWVLRNFATAVFGQARGVDENGPEKNLRNWRNGVHCPDPKEEPLIFKVLFGDNPELADWKRDLQDALERKREEKAASRTKAMKAAVRLTTVSPVATPTAHFMGRDDDVDALATILASSEGSSALLVQGGPGMGKTELTKAVAHHAKVASRFAARRFFVPLETATTAAAMQDAIIRAIGGDPALGFATALHGLHGRDTLLVLDNLETPWEPRDQRAATEQVIAELADTAGMIVLASLRGTAAIRGFRWRKHPVKPFDSSVAAELFISIAGPGFAHDPHLADIIRVLGGIPLAIDLVARRADGLAHLEPLWREWRRIGAELADDPDLKAGRLTSLTHSIELSLRSPRMSDAAWRLFSLLGVLPAGMAITDAQTMMAGEALLATEQLRHVGIVSEHTDRIDLLPPIREHALRRYRPEANDNEAWVAHYLNAISLLGRMVGTASGAQAIQRLRAEFRNIEAALRTKLSNRAEAAEAFHYFTRAARWSPIPTTLLDELVAACRQQGDALGEGNYVKIIGDLALDRSDYDAAHAAYLRASALFKKSENRPERQANCVRMMGNVALYRADYLAAESTYEQAILLYRETDDRLGEANCIKGLASIALHRADYPAAQTSFAEARSLYRAVGDDLGEANCLKGMADIALRQSDHATAASDFEKARGMYSRIGDTLGMANCEKRLGDIALYQARPADARRAYEEALALYDEIGNRLGKAECTSGFGDVALSSGDMEAAQSAFENARVQFEQIGSLLGLAQSTMRLGDVTIMTGSTDAARVNFEEAQRIFAGIGDEIGQQGCSERIAKITTAT